MAGQLTVDDPKDATKKSLRVGGGIAVDVNDPNKRFSAFNYENFPRNIFMRTFAKAQMPTSELAVPKLLRGSEWSDAYGTEKLVIKSVVKYTPSGRADFDINADIDELLNGFADADAEAEATFYRTEEQVELFRARENAVEGAEAGDDLYSKVRKLVFCFCIVRIRKLTTVNGS